VYGPAQRPAFSRRLAAFANATETGNEMDSNTQKRPDLARRKAVGWNALFGGNRSLLFSLVSYRSLDFTKYACLLHFSLCYVR
jgi:hypothetical protein